jgi:hypothetical protein
MEMDRGVLVARLEQLEQMGLAARVSSGRWSLAGDWQERLREQGERRDVLLQMHRAMGGDPARYHVVKPGQEVPKELREGRDHDRGMVGRVAAKGLSDELRGRFYAVIETSNGAGYHVTLDARTAERVRAGEVVKIVARPERSPERQQDRGVGIRGDEPVRSRMHVRGVSSLEAQIAHRGPVWLDTVEPKALAPYGFGADVRRAVERRREVLRGRGISPDDGLRVAKLRELERRTVGEGVAARRREQFLAQVPRGFRGDVERAPDGAPYVVVSDGARFVLLRASRDTRDFVGKSVAVTRDAQVRIVLRGLDRGLER